MVRVGGRGATPWPLTFVVDQAVPGSGVWASDVGLCVLSLTSLVSWWTLSYPVHSLVKFSLLWLESKLWACVSIIPPAETNHCLSYEAAVTCLFILGSEVHREQSTASAHVGWAEENQDGGSQRAARLHHSHPRTCEPVLMTFYSNSFC